MPKAMKTKEERIELRVKPQDKRLLEKAAQSQGLSLSSYLVSRSLVAAQEDAAPYRTYSITGTDCKRFLETLENPPKPNPKLKAAMKRFKKVMG